jgi:hypothetical protein
VNTVKREREKKKQPEQPRKVMSWAGTSEIRERWYTVRLFGTNSLKEEAVWRLNQLRR